VNCSSLLETLYSALNYTNGCPLMCMSRKRVCKVLRVKKFDIPEVIRTPNLGELALGFPRPKPVVKDFVPRTETENYRI
jgi:hypothetical protein